MMNKHLVVCIMYHYSMYCDLDLRKRTAITGNNGNLSRLYI